MSQNYGKLWEQKVKDDFLKVPGATIDRLYDQTTGHAFTSANVCDFIGFIGDELTDKGNIYYIEAKSCHKNTFPLVNLRQYDKLKFKVGLPGVRAGVVLWFIDHQTVLYVPISTFTQLIKDGKKSVNIKMIDENEYNIITIPSVTKRTFPVCDYNILTTLKRGE